jgi:hypothetical protein
MSPAGVYNSEMARRFPENVCTPVPRLDITRGLMNAKYEFYSITILVGTGEPCCSLVSEQSTFAGQMTAAYRSSTGALTVEVATIAGVPESS